MNQNSKIIALRLFLNELLSTAKTTLEDNHMPSGLLLLYCLIDTCAAISDETRSKENNVVFKAHIEKYVQLPSTVTANDLWAARSSLLHTMSPFGRNTEKKAGGARPLFYYAWPDDRREVEEKLRVRGYEDFVLLNAKTIFFVANDSIENLFARITIDPDFEKLVLDRAGSLLRTQQQYMLEDELTAMTRLENTPDAAAKRDC